MDRFAPTLTKFGVAAYAPHYLQKTGSQRATAEMILDGKHFPQWLAAIRDGAFSFGKVTDEEFAGLKYVPFGEGSWRFVALGSREDRDKADHVFHYDEKFEESDWKKFHDALRDHQRMVLEGILPEYQLPRSYDDAKARGL